MGFAGWNGIFRQSIKIVACCADGVDAINPCFFSWVDTVDDVAQQARLLGLRVYVHDMMAAMGSMKTPAKNMNDIKMNRNIVCAALPEI